MLALLDQLTSVFFFCTLAVAAFGIGRPILRGLGVGQDDRLSVAVWSTALGLVAAGMALVGLGLVGLLYAPLIGVLTLAACFWGLGEIARSYLRACQRPLVPEGLAPQNDPAPEVPIAGPTTWLTWGVLAAAALACVGSFTSALAPPTAGDALCYHLELPKRFLLEHRIVYLPYHDNATFPLLTEIWFLWGLAVDGGTCAQLVHWGLGVLLALATVVLATPILGRPWAWVAGAVVLLTPGVNNQMTAPLNDVALAAMTTLALAAWWRAVVSDEGRRWFIVAGLAGGAALGTKYIAAVFAAAVGATWLWAMVRQPDRRRLLLEGSAVVAVVAVSVGGIWYVRAAWHRGNPVFPFLSEVFVEAGDAPADARGTLPASKSPLGRNPASMAIAAWQVTMHPERFGGRGHQLGVVLLATLPGLLFVRRLRGLGILLAVAAVYGIAWFLLRQNVRFLLPAVPLLTVAAVWVWIEVRRFPPPTRAAVAATFAVVLLAMALVPLRRARDQLAVATGLEDRENYLCRHEPTYTAAAVANLLMKPEDHLLTQDHRAFYFAGRVTRENIYRRYTNYDREVREPAELSRQLREAGFTHLLLARAVGDDGTGYDPTLRRLVEAQEVVDRSDSLLTLTEYRFRDAEGVTREYRLVKLQ